jgi:hypothetical protein
MAGNSPSLSVTGLGGEEVEPFLSRVSDKEKRVFGDIQLFKFNYIIIKINHWLNFIFPFSE